jgi:hypothetical protein
MSPPGSRPPVQPQRKLVLRRKVQAEQGSQAAAPNETKDAPAPTLPPPPTLLPRAHRPIEHPPELERGPKPGSIGDSGVGWRSSSGSKAAALLTSRSGATPVPLPSRVSVAPVVASVPMSNRPPPAAPAATPRGQRLLLPGGIIIAGALVAAAVLVGTRLQIRSGPPITTAPLDVTRAAASPGNRNAPPPAEGRADRVTSVEDLPRAPVPARGPVGGTVHSVRAPSAPPRATAEASVAGLEAAPSASSSPATASASESQSAQVPEVEVPSVPPPPPDPLIRAVQQSIDDGTGK